MTTKDVAGTKARSPPLNLLGFCDYSTERAICRDAAIAVRLKPCDIATGEALTHEFICIEVARRNDDVNDATGRY